MASNQSLYYGTIIPHLVFALGASGTMVQVAVYLRSIYVVSMPSLFWFYFFCVLGYIPLFLI